MNCWCNVALSSAWRSLTLRCANAIIESLIASVTAEADAASPNDEELQQYLLENADRFSFVASVAVAAWQTDDEAAAQSFVTALRHDGSVNVSDAIGPDS